MIVISIKSSKHKILIDTQHHPLTRDEDTDFLLKEWGVTDASYTVGDVLVGIDALVNNYMKCFTTLNTHTNPAKEGEIARFVGEVYPLLKAWDDEGRPTLTYHNYITDANGIKLYICLTFQELHPFNR